MSNNLLKSIETWLKQHVINWRNKYYKDAKYPLIKIAYLSLCKLLVQIASLFLVLVGGGILLPLLVQSNVSSYDIYKGIFIIILGIMMYAYIEKWLAYRISIQSKKMIKKYKLSYEPRKKI